MNFKKLILVFLIIFCAISLFPREHNFFVSGELGNDTFKGTKDHPFKTIEAAVNAAGKCVSGQVNIHVRAGVYTVDETININGFNTNNKKLLIKNYEKESVVLTGGVQLPGNRFQLVKNKGILSRLPAASRKHVYYIDLRTEGVTNFGKRVQHGFGYGIQPAPLELFCNKEALPIARWPNTGRIPVSEVLEAGSNPRKGDFSDKGAVFKVKTDRVSKWDRAKEMWVTGYFYYGWADDHIAVDSLDVENRIFKLKQPHFYSVRSSNAYKENILGFYVYNLLEEIDEPGEWYLDTSTGHLYVWPPDELSALNFEISLLEDPFISIENSKHVTISGLTFECARGMGVFIDNSTHCSIEESVFRNLGTVAVSCGLPLNESEIFINADGSPNMDGDFREFDIYHVEIDGCKIYNTGTGGVILKGGNRKNLSSGNNSVSNCEFFNFSRINTTYSPAVKIDGAGNHVRNCYIHHAPHQGISFQGNNHKIEYNHFYEVCTDAHDMGVIYTGRDPSSRGTLIRHNYFEQIGVGKDGSLCAVYIDDGSGGITIDGNIFNNAINPGPFNFGAVFIHGGKDNVCTNNLFMNCRIAFGITPWNNKKWHEYVNSPIVRERIFKHVDINAAIYREQYPELKYLGDTLSVRVNTASNNIFFKGTQPDNGREGFNLINNVKINEAPAIQNVVFKHNFESRYTPMINCINFKRIPFERIGIKRKLDVVVDVECY